jgi:hypothetical protein
MHYASSGKMRVILVSRDAAGKRFSYLCFERNLSWQRSVKDIFLQWAGKGFAS